MPRPEASGPALHRLDPFAFPSGTDFRFILLIAAVLSAALFVGNGLFLDVGKGGADLLATARQCFPLAPNVRVGEYAAALGRDGAEFVRKQEAFERCMAPHNRRNAAWMLGAAAAVFGAAALLYWIWPAWRIRRHKLRPLPVEDMPEVAAYLTTLCERAGLSKHPAFLVNPLNRSTGGLAFGRLGRHYVVLNGGLIGEYFRDRDAFAAVVLHELAHLRNADVDKTYFTLATWYAFLGVALLPYAASLLDAGVAFASSVAWRVLALAALIYLTRNAVLRAREIQADVRASAWADGAGLGRMLARLPALRDDASSILRTHPPPSARIAAIADTRALFVPDLWEAFGTGIAASVAYSGIRTVIDNLATGLNIATLAPLSAALLVAPLVAAVVIAATWRAEFVALVTGGAPHRLRRFSLALVAGFLVGRLIGIDHVVETATAWSVSGAMAYALALAVWGLLLLAGMAMLIRWVAGSAELWLEMAVTSGAPRAAYRAGLALGAGMTVLYMGALFPPANFIALPPAAGLVAALTSTVLVGGMMFGYLFLTPSVFVMFGLISLWAFPLAAQWWGGRRRSTTTPGGNWAWLDAPAPGIVLRDRARTEARAAARTGVRAGLCFCVLLLIVSFAWRAAFDQATRDRDGMRLALFATYAAVSAAVQAVAAWRVARRTARMPIVHGMLAAFVSGSVATVATIALNTVNGGVLDPSWIAFMFRSLVEGGAIPALAAGALASRRGASQASVPAAPPLERPSFAR